MSKSCWNQWAYRMAVAIGAVVVLASTQSRAESSDATPAMDRDDAPALWAQRLSGTDLARDEAEATSRARALDVGIVAASRRERLAALFVDPIVGGAGRVTLVATTPVEWPTTTDRLVAVARELRRKRPAVALIGIELAGDDALRAAYAELAAQGTTLVIASGDRFPRAMPEIAAYLPAIRVANLSETGLIELSSQEDTEIDVAAPAGKTLTSIVHEDGVALPAEMGGTAGAAALVAGAVANVLAFLPGATSKELKTLLRLTALRTANARETARQNGAGMLNAYRMVSVARRLSGGWPQNRRQIGDVKSAAHDFRVVTAQLDRHAEELGTPVSVGTRKQKSRLLRRAFLLEPTEARRRALVADAQLRSLDRDVAVLASLAPDFDGWLAAKLADGNADVALAALRLAGNLGRTEVVAAAIRESLLAVAGNDDFAERARRKMTVALAVSHGSAPVFGRVPEGVAKFLLETAALLGRKQLLLGLLDAGNRPRELDVSFAAAAGQLEIVKTLLSRGARADGANDGSGRLPLLAAIRTRNNLAVVRLLLDRGAAVNGVALSGESAIALAVSQRDLATVELLLAAKADPMQGKVRGRTAIEIAQSQGDSLLVARLCRSATTACGFGTVARTVATR